jgi:Zn-dependent protease
MTLIIVAICLFFIATNVVKSPQSYLFSIISIILAVTIHEAAHAWSADELGDPTARLMGRKTLNPLAHLDPVGSILFIVAGFGWGKPVPVDPFNLKDDKDEALVSLAGPVSNLLFAGVVGILYHFIPSMPMQLALFFYTLALINVSLAVFNLLPIPPLDGSKLYRAILPKGFLPVWEFLDQYGMYILLFMFLSGTSLFGRFLSPIVQKIMTVLGF